LLNKNEIYKQIRSGKYLFFLDCFKLQNLKHKRTVTKFNLFLKIISQLLPQFRIDYLNVNGSVVLIEIMTPDDSSKV
jgi:hypothetical protein